MLIGTATTGIALASTANNNTAYPNAIDAGSMTNAVTDAGSGNLTTGASVSGSSCTITAIVQGVITAATCTP